MAIGARGAVGAPALSHVVGGHRDGRGSVTTLRPHWEAPSVRAPARKFAAVTKRSVQSFW